MSYKRRSLKKILGQFLLVSSIFAILYFAVILITEKMGGNFKRDQVIQSRKSKPIEQKLDQDFVREITERKKNQDKKSMIFLVIGLSLATGTFALSLIKSKK